MVWGAITAHGRTGLVIFGRNEKANASGYLKVIEEKVKLHMNITGITIFQQDSAPCHTAKVVKKWFCDNDVKLLEDWPSNSANLNVIENCWSTMKKSVARKCLLKLIYKMWSKKCGRKKFLLTTAELLFEACLKGLPPVWQTKGIQSDIDWYCGTLLSRFTTYI